MKKLTLFTMLAISGMALSVSNSKAATGVSGDKESRTILIQEDLKKEEIGIIENYLDKNQKTDEKDEVKILIYSEDGELIFSGLSGSEESKSMMFTSDFLFNLDDQVIYLKN